MNFNHRKIAKAVSLAFLSASHILCSAQNSSPVVPLAVVGSGQESISSVDRRTIITNPLAIEGCNSGLRWSAGAGKYWCPGVVADPSPAPAPSYTPVVSPPPAPAPYTPAPAPYEPPIISRLPYFPVPDPYTPPVYPPYTPPDPTPWTPPPAPAPEIVVVAPPDTPPGPAIQIFYPGPPAQELTQIYPQQMTAPVVAWVPVYGGSDSGLNFFVAYDLATGNVVGFGNGAGANGYETPTQIIPFVDSSGIADR